MVLRGVEVWKEVKTIRRYLPYQCPIRDLSVPSPSPRMAAPLAVLLVRRDIGEQETLASE